MTRIFSPQDAQFSGSTFRLEALWAFQGLRVVEADVLREVLSSPDPRARAAAVCVLGDWHSSIPEASKRLATAVSDDHPQVRLEAVNALRSIGGTEGVELALHALDRPLDKQLDYALWLTVRELERFWLPALEAGEPVFGLKPHWLAFALSAVGNEASLAPLVELAQSGELSGRERREALAVIAAMGTSNDRAIVLDAVVK